MKNPLKVTLENAYLDWFNNYLSTAKYASDNDLLPDIALRIIILGKEIHLLEKREENKAKTYEN